MSAKNDYLTPSGSAPPKSTKGENRPFKIKWLEGKNDDFLPTNHGITRGKNLSPRQRRTLAEAKKVIEKSSLSGDQRVSALRRLRKAKQPIAEARRIICWHLADSHKLKPEAHREIDLSDIQELKIKLIRRDKGIWSPQTDYLHRMEKDLLTNGMTQEEFKRRAAIALNMDQPLSKEFRHAEWKLARTGEWD